MQHNSPRSPSTFCKFESENLKNSTWHPLAISLYTSTTREIQDRDLLEIQENIFLAVKSEIQICENFSVVAKCKKSEIRENFIDDASR